MGSCKRKKEREREREREERMEKKKLPRCETQQGLLRFIRKTNLRRGLSCMEPRVLIPGIITTHRDPRFKQFELTGVLIANTGWSKLPSSVLVPSPRIWAISRRVDGDAQSIRGQNSPGRMAEGINTPCLGEVLERPGRLAARERRPDARNEAKRTPPPNQSHGKERLCRPHWLERCNRWGGKVNIKLLILLKSTPEVGLRTVSSPSAPYSRTRTRRDRRSGRSDMTIGLFTETEYTDEHAQ
ncbi:hypothetical protein P170DRAFT_437165 [Aspergillus steynii IBT 23096]|uniref:Uncharacterized protein n=1 Tax=Aspergillus steynii IBT 23096 TaxID=1392250 RepID=A0A2I2G9N2_9EURO|nr:uncharacterized protein P170DRAFT_437165 [Aspergillus steynii IBT 23096]PLB49587.1 hypothetical protein P170DRAFT_437165 [Aspergillus steynii IBT 23096]